MSKNLDISAVKATARVGVREIYLRHFSSGNVVVALDDGCDSDGRPNQQRQHLLNTLKKRLRFRSVEVATFMLDRAPGAWPAPRSPREAQLHAMDRFDVDVLKNRGTGEWEFPNAKWIELSDAARATEQIRVDEVKSKARGERAAKGLEALEVLKRLSEQAAAPAPAPKAKS